MYRHTDVKYFPLGEEMLEAMIEDLKKAEKCIFWSILLSVTA